MRDELHHRRQQRQLNNAARYAVLHGTPTEQHQVEAVVHAVDNGHITPPDALEALRQLRRDQQRRAA